MMANIRLKLLLLCVCILFPPKTNGGYQECVISLRNTAVYVGALNTLLACPAGPNSTASYVRPTSEALTDYNITNFDDTVNSTLTNLYAYNSSGLIVRNATTTPTGGPITTAGIYFMNFAGTANRTAAKLVVIQSGPNCSCIELASGGVNISCNIVYADHPVAPIVPIVTCTANGQTYTSYTPPRNAIPYNSTYTFYVYNSTSTVTINNTVPTTYDCRVTFSAPPNTQTLAKNAPDFSVNFTACSEFIPSTTTPPSSPPTPGATTLTTLPSSPPTRACAEATTTQPISSTTTLTTLPTRPSTPGTTLTTLPTRPSTPGTTLTTLPSRPPTPGTTTQPMSVFIPSTTILTTLPSRPPTPGQNCTKASECQSDGTIIYNYCVVKAELYAKCANCCQEDLVCGVVVTLGDGSRWFIHDPLCDDGKCEMVVVDASCMFSDWKLLAEKEITFSGVSDYTAAGNIANFNMTDCSESCKRMMNLP